MTFHGTCPRELPRRRYRRPQHFLILYAVQYSGIFENGGFFLRFSLPSMRERRFRAPKMQVFYKGPRVEMLENAGFSVTSGRTKTEVFDDVMHQYH